MTKFLRWFAIAWASLLLLVLLGAIIATLLGPTVPNETVVRVTFRGEIPELPAHGWRQLLQEDTPLTLFGLTAAIRRAARDERVIGLILDVQEPQVGLAQIEELEAAMAVFRASGKWNAAFLETAGELSRGDGPYALAAMADHIVLAPPGEINLFGLRAEVPFIKNALDRLSVDVTVEKREAYKTFANTFSQSGLTAEHREALAGILDDLEQGLLTHVATRRSVSREEVEGWIAASPFSAPQAAEKGLVDELGYWDTLDTKVREMTGRDDGILDIAAYDARSQTSPSGPTFAVIYGVGQIHRGLSDELGSQEIGADTIARAFREARKREVKGVLFRVDSPGGSWVGSDLIRREVEVTRAAGIPVIASMGNVAASGGYILSMGASRVVSDPSSLTGSIGVVGVHMAARRALEKWLGITFGVYETHPGAGILNSLDPPNEQERRRFAQSVDRMYEAFVTQAAQDRGKTYEEMHAVAQGRVWTGRQALERGLVDELGGIYEAVSALKEEAGVGADEPIVLQRLPEQKSALAQLLSSLLTVRERPLDDVLSRIGTELGVPDPSRPQPVRAPLPSIHP